MKLLYTICDVYSSNDFDSRQRIGSFLRFISENMTVNWQGVYPALTAQYTDDLTVKFDAT